MINEFIPDDNYMGEFIIDDEGISFIVSKFDNGSYLSKMIIPKEIFIEAYKRWIKGDNYEQRQTF